jgi:hypothetical protein
MKNYIKTWIKIWVLATAIWIISNNMQTTKFWRQQEIVKNKVSAILGNWEENITFEEILETKSWLENWWMTVSYDSNGNIIQSKYTKCRIILSRKICDLWVYLGEPWKLHLINQNTNILNEINYIFWTDLDENWTIEDEDIEILRKSMIRKNIPDDELKLIFEFVEWIK